MSKKYRDKLCVYCCRNTSDTADHIFAREFFMPEDRDNLPKVPACGKCNKEKSALEHYLITALSFGGKHGQATANLEANAPRRLGRNQKLHRRLFSGVEMAWLRDDGAIYAPTMSIPFDGTKLEQLLKHIVRGLTWHHFGKYVRSDWSVRVLFPPDMVSNYFQAQLSTLPPERIVKGDLGRGTMQYEGAMVGPPDLFLLKVLFYGGVMLAKSDGSQSLPGEISRAWWMLAGAPELAHQVNGAREVKERLGSGRLMR
jgi:hypothetical protein